MKNFLFCCLLTAGQAAFAQTIDLQEFEALLTKRSADSINEFLATKGFQNVKVGSNRIRDGLQNIETWRFQWESSPATLTPTLLGKCVDINSGKAFYRIFTTNPLLYAHLVNQFCQNDFIYRSTFVKEKAINMLFSNNNNEIIMRLYSEPRAQKYYEINIGEGISKIDFFKIDNGKTKQVTVTPNQ